MEECYLLGIVAGSTPELAKYRGYLLSLIPAGTALSIKPVICLDEPAHRGESFARNANRWLRGWPEPEVPYGTVVRPEPGRSYFLERMCADAGCAWFIPMFRRMASEEEVPIEEIQRAYQAHNGGQSMRYGYLPSFFDPKRR